MKMNREHGGKMAAEQRAFAVTKVGVDRWYWCVWPAHSEVSADVDQAVVAEGAESTKMAALDAALAKGGKDAIWTLGKYARRQYKNRGKAAGGTPSQVEWLYHDVYDAETGAWRSDRHRVVKRTASYVHIHPLPEAGNEVQSSYGWHGERPLRLARELLEGKGYAAVSLAAADRYRYDDPFFFSTPFTERVPSGVDLGDCFARLGLQAGATRDEIRAAYRRRAMEVHPDRGGIQEDFVALQQAYRQALANCRENQD